MAEIILTAAQQTLDRQLQSVPFLAGVEQGRWQIVRYEFPNLEVNIAGFDPTHNTRTTMGFQLKFDNFPAWGPFVQSWDHASGRRAAPISTSSPSVVDAFKEWSEQTSVYGGIYRVWQRGAAPHNNWAVLRPDEAWHRGRHITFIMERLYELVSEHASWLGRANAA